MTTSRSMHSLSKPTGRDKISGSTIAYLQTRTKMRAFNLVHKEFKKSGLSQADLAARLGKGTDRVNKILSAPGNWTLDTITELLFAISGGVVSFNVTQPLEANRRNDTRPHWVETGGLVPHGDVDTSTSSTVRLTKFNEVTAGA